VPILINRPALHHKHAAADRCSVLQRIAVEGDDIGLHAGSQRADLVLHVHRLRRDGGGRFNRLHGILPALTHSNDEFFVISAMRPGHGVGAIDNLQILVGEGLFEGVAGDRESLFHERKSLFVIVAATIPRNFGLFSR